MDGTSYNEDKASTIACGGSVMEARSLTETKEANNSGLGCVTFKN